MTAKRPGLMKETPIRRRSSLYVLNLQALTMKYVDALAVFAGRLVDTTWEVGR